MRIQRYGIYARYPRALNTTNGINEKSAHRARKRGFSKKKHRQTVEVRIIDMDGQFVQVMADDHRSWIPAENAL